MARTGITYDQVKNAAAAIKARGLTPTIAAVRVELGNEGSYTTISQHLAKWKSEDADKATARDLPPDVENAMLEAVNTVWQIANKYAQEDVNAVRQSWDDEKKNYTEELNTAKAEIENLDELITKNEAEIEKLKKELADALHAHKAAQNQLDATTRLYYELMEATKAALIKQPPQKVNAHKKQARSTDPATASENKPGELQ